MFPKCLTILELFVALLTNFDAMIVGFMVLQVTLVLILLGIILGKMTIKMGTEQLVLANIVTAVLTREDWRLLVLVPVVILKYGSSHE